MSDKTQHDNDWKALKDELEKSMQSAPMRYDNLEDILDDRIRQRFGEMIYRATLKCRKR